MVLSEHSRDAHDRPDANVVSIGAALIFERLWRETGCQEVVRKLLATRHHHFDVERAVFMTVLHRLMVSGSDRSALQWRRDQAIDGAEALKLQHLYRAMGWLGEALGEREPDAPSPRRVKDLIEEELFARRRDLFSALGPGVLPTPPRCSSPATVATPSASTPRARTTAASANRWCWGW